MCSKKVDGCEAAMGDIDRSCYDLEEVFLDHGHIYDDLAAKPLQSLAGFAGTIS
jgi:hypothetical protein